MFAPELAGPHDPLLSIPPPRAGSVRRTTSIDSHRRPDGSVVDVDAWARDVRTDASGGRHVLDEIRLRAQLDQAEGTISKIDAEPEHGDLDLLLDCRVGPGFRHVVKERLETAVERGSLLNHLLDDWSGARLVSGYAMQRASELAGADPLRIPAEHLASTADICAGWASDASIMVTLGRTQLMPTPIGPSIPSIDPPTEEAAHFPTLPLPPGATRRRRRLELWPIDQATLGFETHFRDSYAEDTDTQSVLHEYLVVGSLDRAALVVRMLEAQALVLPWQECPAALASAQRLVGRPVTGLRQWVRSDLRGTSTCTHLNDTLRTLEDLESLATGVA